MKERGWHQLSPSRQSWTVYRIVRKLEPDARLDKVYTALLNEVSVRGTSISPSRLWCRARLERFTDENILRREIVDGKPVWYTIPSHDYSRRQSPAAEIDVDARH